MNDEHAEAVEAASVGPRVDPNGSREQNSQVTRILTGRDLREILTIEDSLRALWDGFMSTSPIPGQRYRTDLPFMGTATALLPGTLEGVPAFSTKTNAKFPEARPALRGIVCVHSGLDGSMLGILDSATITAWRTGLAAAIATHLLAVPKASVIAVVGAGAQAALMIRGLQQLRGRLHVVVSDIDEERAADFAHTYGGRTAASAQEAVDEAEIALFATWARDPIALEFVPTGMHITTLGSDEPGKHELTPTTLSRGLLVVDDVEQSHSMGVLAYSDRDADATISDIVKGRHPGRTSEAQNTIYAPVGLPWQDLSLAWLALQAAEKNEVGAVLQISP
jgi:ornithine cyclodeaminase/alanine dehydrogenase-like protein (mu-crystallin family)